MFINKFFFKNIKNINIYINVNARHKNKLFNIYQSIFQEIMNKHHLRIEIKDLTHAHEHLSIDESQFEAFCEVLEGTLLEHGLDDESIREVFIFIEPQRDQIVNKDRAKPLL